MKKRILMGASLAVALFNFTAHAAMLWSPAPAKHGHGGHDRHAAKSYLLHDGAGASIQLINPKLNAMPMTAEQGRVSVKAMGMDNYHALVATRSDGSHHESAVRYVYMFGKPSGESPSLLMGHEKAALELEPAPYAREHWRYLTSTDALFILRFKGDPVAFADVKMTTGNGTRLEFKSDAEGRLSIPLPEDFPAVKPGRMGNRPAEFVLSATHESNGKTFATTFSADYHINPDHWQSTPLGLAVVGGGMLLGGLITWRSRRRKEKK